MATKIILLLQLVGEGWKMSTSMLNDKKSIKVSKKNQRMTFCENVKKNLCFLTANISTTQRVASVINEDENGTIYFLTNQIQNKLLSTPEDNLIEKGSLETWNYNDFDDKFGHHGDEKMRAMAKRMCCRLTENLQVVMNAL